MASRPKPGPKSSSYWRRPRSIWQRPGSMANKRNPDTLLFHLSDIHFGLEDNKALDWVQQEIAERRPQAVAITGDLTMRARQREFAAASHWIRSLDAPVTVEIGNHDMPYFNLIERFFAPYRRFHAIEGLIEREIDLP